MNEMEKRGGGAHITRKSRTTCSTRNISSILPSLIIVLPGILWAAEGKAAVGATAFAELKKICKWRILTSKLPYMHSVLSFFEQW